MQSDVAGLRHFMYEICKIKYLKYEKSQLYTIQLQIYWDYKFLAKNLYSLQNIITKIKTADLFNPRHIMTRQDCHKQEFISSGEGRYSHVFYEREKPEIHRNSEAASNLDVVELRNNIIKVFYNTTFI